MHLRARRNKTNGQTISPDTNPTRQHARVNSPTHLIHQAPWYTRAIALHHIAGPHPHRSNNVALLARLDARQQRHMRRAVGVVLDALDALLARRAPLEVDNADATSVAAAAMADGHAAGGVAPAFRVALLRVRERLV